MHMKFCVFLLVQINLVYCHELYPLFTVVGGIQISLIKQVIVQILLHE